MIKSFDVRFCWFASCNFFPLSHYCMSLPLTFWATQELLINYLRLFSMTQTPPDPKLFFSFQSVICICGSAQWQMSVTEISCNVSAGSVVWPPSHGWQGLWLRGQLDHTQPGALHADRPLCPPPPRRPGLPDLLNLLNLHSIHSLDYTPWIGHLFIVILIGLFTWDGAGTWSFWSLNQ